MSYKNLKKIIEEETAKSKKKVRKANRESELFYEYEGDKISTQNRRQREADLLIRRVNAVAKLLKDTTEDMRRMGLSVDYKAGARLQYRDPISKQYTCRQESKIIMRTNGIREHLMDITMHGLSEDNAGSKAKLRLTMGTTGQFMLKDFFNENGSIKGSAREEIQKFIVSKATDRKESCRVGLLSWQSKYR